MKKTYNILLKASAVLLLGLSATASMADERFKVSTDGQEVTDTQANVTWRRCVEGMNWDGKTCAGKASKFSFAAAKKYASAQAPVAGKNWRVPTKAELMGLVDKGQKKKPKIDGAVFPATPAALSWATRPEDNDSLNAWIVDFANGKVYGNSGTKAPTLRLVR